MAWRLNRVGVTWARAHKDMTNAFMCTFREAMDEVVDDIFDEED